MLGAAIATALSYALMFLWLFYKNKNWLPINLMWYDIIALGMMAFLSIWSLEKNVPGQFYIMGTTLVLIIYLLYKHGIKNLILLFK